MLRVYMYIILAGVSGTTLIAKLLEAWRLKTARRVGGRQLPSGSTAGSLLTLEIYLRHPPETLATPQRRAAQSIKHANC